MVEQFCLVAFEIFLEYMSALQLISHVDIGDKLQIISQELLDTYNDTGLYNHKMIIGNYEQLYTVFFTRTFFVNTYISCNRSLEKLVNHTY